eukprot:SAG31_NODE_82_length_27046_cov_45.857275_19_plen_194_part_00
MCRHVPSRPLACLLHSLSRSHALCLASVSEFAGSLTHPLESLKLPSLQFPQRAGSMLLNSAAPVCPPASLLCACMLVQPPTLDEDPLHDMRPDDPANGSQWDQLAPLLPKVALRQVAKASVTTDTIWSGTSPAAVLVIRLPGFTKMCDEWAAGNDTMPLSRLLNSLYAKLVACARRRGGDLVHFLGEVKRKLP